MLTRLATLLVLATSACLSPSETARIHGEYVVENYDSVIIDRNLGGDGYGYGGIVLDITARDDLGTLDDGTFHSPTANGPFGLDVPRGSEGVHLVFHQHTADGNDRQTDYLVLDVVNDDLDVGTVLLP